MSGFELAVAWDVDGTLVDSEPLHLRALLAVCRAHGVDIADFGPVPFLGVAIHDVWRQIGSRFVRWGPSDVQPFCDAVSDAYLREVHDLQQRPGAVETVRALSALGVRQCAVSNSEAGTVHANLNQLGLGSHMDFCITLSDVSQPKPAPQPYLMACERLGLPPSQVIAVEDSASGIASARAAGLVAVLYTVEPRWRGWQQHADHLLQALSDLPALHQGIAMRHRDAGASLAIRHS